MSSTLGDLLKSVVSAGGGGGPFLAHYGMGRNPFPPARTIYPEVIYNQEDAVHLFAGGVGEIVQNDLARRTLAILGGTGQGKSHFLRHCQYEVAKNSLPLVTLEFLAGTSSAVTLVRDIFRAADEHVKRNGETDLLSAVVNRLEGDDFGPVRQTDLRKALGRLQAASRSDFRPEDMYGRFTAEVLRDVAWRWVSGETLTMTEKRYLRVSGRLATASLMIRVMTEIFALAKQQGLFRGVMLCLDEVESIFFSGVSVSRIQAFLQDLRYLFDEAVGQQSGYSLLLVAGSTSRGASTLRDYNYPLFQRLGFESEARVELHEVDSLDEARKFADAYLEYERLRFARVNAPGVEDAKPGVTVDRARSLISEQDLRLAFYGPALAPSPDTRNQARLLAELHRIVKEKQTAGTSA